MSSYFLMNINDLGAMALSPVSLFKVLHLVQI